jgi:hypothetical protein
MPWSTHDFPPAMKRLPPPVRRLAIRVANALLERGYSEGEAIRIAIAQAKRHFTKGFDLAFLPGYYAGYDPDGWPIVLWAEPALVKGGEPLAPNERWITLKPHGPDHPDYVHVKIKIWPDGTAHVISGPKGLHGLRLTRLGQGPKAKPSKGDRVQKQALSEAHKQVLQEAHRQAIEAAQKLLDNPLLEKYKDLEGLKEELKSVLGEHAKAMAGDEDAAKMAAGMAASRHLQRLRVVMGRLERGLLEAIASDEEARRAVLGPRPVQEEKPKGGAGYQTNLKKEAAEKGFTDAEARQEDEAFFQKRLSEMDPEQAERAIRARLRAREAGALQRPLGEAAKRTAPVPQVEPPKPQEVVAKAEAVRGFLEAMRRVREAERQARLARFGHDDPEALEALARTLGRARYPIQAEEVDPETAKALEERLGDLTHERHMRDLLDTVAATGEPEWTPGEIRRTMLRFHRAGVYAHIADVGHGVLGREPVDRLVVEALGPDAAVALTARALFKELPPEHLERVRKALEERHEELLARIPEAVERAKKALEAARAIQLPDLEEGREAHVVEALLKERRRLLEEARREVGGLLGQLEASALLNYALRGQVPERLEVEFGDRSVREAAHVLRALGLQDGDYEWRKEGGKLKAVIHPHGLDRLLAEAPDPEEVATTERLKAIRRGDEDEEDWLPAGFTRYPASALDARDEALPKPLRHASPPDFSQGFEAGLKRFIGERLADGWTPLEVKRALSSASFMADWVPQGREGEYLEALEALLPTYAGEAKRKNKHGEEYTVKIPVDYAHLEEKHPELHERLRALAREVAGRDAYPDETLEDTPEARKALYATLLEDPRLQLAHKPLGDLTPQDQRALRSYYLTEILGLSPEEMARKKEEAKRALEEYDRKNPEPPKWGQADPGALFADEESWNPARPITLRFRTQDPLRRRRLLKALNLTEEGEHYLVNEDGSITLTEAGKERLTPVQDPEDLEALEGDLPLSPQWRRWWMGRKRAAAEALGEKDLVEWPEFVEMVGGPHRAYTAIQEHMRGRLAGRFAKLHAAFTGRPLRLSKRENPYGEHLWHVQDPESYREFRQRQREAMEGLRAREGGRFAHMGGRGSLLEAYRAMREAERAGRGAQALLLDAGAGDPRLEPEEPVPFLERPALAPGVENRLAAMTQAVKGSLHPGMNPVRLIPDLTMGKGTPYAKQQRAIRSIIAGKKQALFLGVGSGKTGVSIGAFTELHHQGKARKGFFVVPSIVRNQFGEEMARFLEPGLYRWHAQEAPAEERIAAMKDPETHMVALTHQAFRDDMLRLMAEHHGEELESFKDRFLQAPLPERQRLMREALEAHQIPLDYLALDEAHDALNRKGKEESLLSAVLDTAMSLAPYGVLMTGTPVKNDASEIGDWLRKLDPERFGDQEAFMRRYGVDARIARDALKRLAERYVYHDVVPSGTQKKEVWGVEEPGDSPTGHRPIPLHPAQEEALKRVEEAYQAARRAWARGEVNLEALKVLSPESFARVPEEKHLEVARRLQESLGVLRHAARQRVIDEAPAEENAKIQHILKLAEERRGKGGVVFATRRKAVEEIARALERAGHRVAILHGGHSAEEKARIRQRFDRGEVDIVVASDAGATGANLQKRGEWLVHYDIPMTWKTYEQRTARIDRLGQRKPIEVHTLMTDTDHDRENWRRIKEKKLLGDIFHGPYESMDDRGLALHLKLAGKGGEDAA